ncbi:MAG: hypothetical protein N2513_06785 [Deltaproteobacteria bacterium]|nr:hypothetical protein [Deltaproteobacteria bacterium]
MSLEGKRAFVYIPEYRHQKTGKHFKVQTEELQLLLEQENVEDVAISLFMEGLQVLRLPIQIGISAIRKNESLIKSIVRTEIQKRYPSAKDISYSYRFTESQGRAWITVYVVEKENLKVTEELLAKGFELIGSYPIFLPIVEYVTSEDKELTSRIILLVSDNTRFLFVTEGRDVILQRKFEGTSHVLTFDDVININMTVNYAIQNLRIRISEILIVKKEKQELEGLSLPYRFVHLPQESDLSIVPLLLALYEKQLRNMELLPQEYKHYVKIKKYVSRGKKAILMSLILFFALLVTLLAQYIEISKKLNQKKNAILASREEISRLKQQVSEVEKKVRPIIELTKKKNSVPDSREILFLISDLANIKELSIDSVESNFEKTPMIKIEGKIKGATFEQRQRTFNNLKMGLLMKGLNIFEEKWDLIKGDFSITLGYGA